MLLFWNWEENELCQKDTYNYGVENLENWNM